MASDLEQIQTIKSQTLAVIAQVTAAPKPTYEIDGQSVSWNAYLRRLQLTVDWCDEKLAAYQPFEVQSRACT
jgi:hypothetical protein